MRLFLRAGIDLNSVDRDGYSALARAASQGHLAVAKALLKGKADVNFRHYQRGGTALSIAAGSGAPVEMLQLLIDANADAASIKDAAHAAAGRGRSALLRFLLDRDPGLASSRDDDGDTLLAAAAQRGDIETVKVVTERGVPVKDRGEKGMTPLHRAAGNGHESVVRFLLAAGAEVEAKDDAGMSPLHFAADDGRTAVAAMLLDAGADIDVRCQCPDRYGGGATALMLASRGAEVEVAKLLLERGADPNLTSRGGTTALLLAADTCAIGGGVDLVKPLLDKGANVNAREGADGLTPLMRAQRMPCLATARLLLDRGADIDAKDKDGWSAASYALRTGVPDSVDAVRLLLQRGARLPPDVAMPDGLTPRVWVQTKLKGETRTAMAQLLLERAESAPRR